MLPRALKRTILPLLASRILILIILAAVPAFSQIPSKQWERDDRTTIKISGHQLADAIRRVGIVHDAGWYWTIARDGYERRPFDTSRQANWAFFSLHPLLWRGAAAITGEWLWSGVLLANLWLLLALALLWQLAFKLTQSIRLADRAIVFACFWPTTYFMSLSHTESLFSRLLAHRYWRAHAGPGVSREQWVPSHLSRDSTAFSSHRPLQQDGGTASAS